MKKTIYFLYGSLCYAMFLGVFVWAAAWVMDLDMLPRSVSRGPEAPLGEALLVNTLLLGLFGLQHSGMARAGFKRVWTRLVPQPIERATYVLATNLCFVLLFWQWRPLSTVVWSVDQPLLRGALRALGIGAWPLVVLSTWMVNHFDLFGMRQVWRNLKGLPQAEIRFRTVGFYNFIRHPIQASFLLAFWVTPEMSVGRLLFAGVSTVYILVALKFFEERDLKRQFGETYSDYQRQVGMLVPRSRYRPATVHASAGKPELVA